MFDLNKTFELIKGGLLEPDATWQAYLAENRNWQETAGLLTVPLILLSSIGAWILMLIFGGGAGGALTLGAFLAATIIGLVMFFVIAFVLAYLSGMFDGNNDFDKAVGAMSLASIPNYIGSLIAALPLGFLSPIIQLVALIYSLVLMYRIMPLYLGVPEEKRVVHFIVYLIAAFVVGIVISLVLASILGVGLIGAMATSGA